MAARAAEPRSRRCDPAATRQRVIEAATLLFSTRGFAATGTADIARAANVSEGSIFYHFGSKQNLLVDIGRRYGEQMIAVAQGGQALEDLEPGAMIARSVNFFIEHRECEALATEAEPFYLASREVIGDWLARQMAAAFAKRGIAEIDIPIAAALTYAVVGEAIGAVLATGDAARRAAIVAETTRFVRAACGYPPA